MACPICKEESAEKITNKTSDAPKYDCIRCGQFAIETTAKIQWENGLDDSLRWKVSAYIREFQPEVVTSNDIKHALEHPVPSLHHRADRILRWLAEKYPAGKSFILFNNQEMIPLLSIGWNKNVDEMSFMIRDVLCDEMRLLTHNQGRYSVSPKGFLYLEGRRETISSIGFCAMWFNPDVKPLWLKAIEPAIREAGYEPLRLDESKEYNNRVDDEIMASIRASRFVVADFTGNRGGVYYEAGFAHGLGLDVIFMCREGDDLHFDVRQYNCIYWTMDNLEEAKKRLKNRILATLGQGPKRIS